LIISSSLFKHAPVHYSITQNSITQICAASSGSSVATKVQVETKAIPEMSFSATIKPNPVTTNTLTLMVKNANAKLLVAISDMSGKILLSQQFSATNILFNKTFNLPALPGGIYFIKVDDGHTHRVLKFFKVHWHRKKFLFISIFCSIFAVQ